MRGFGWMLLLWVGCTGASGLDGGRDAAAADASSSADAFAVDAFAVDAFATDALVAPDAVSEADAWVDAGSDAGVEPAGTIAGTCGVLDDELTDPSPFVFRNELFFAEPWSRADEARISEGGREILRDGTAGGSSSYSEVFAFEVLHRCDGAELVKSETEIVYDRPGSITDILVRIAGHPVGVSVTRAVTVTGPCMRSDAYMEAVAEDLLRRKLAGINESTMNVSAADRWVKQILFVFADTAAHADTLRAVWDRIEAALRADTILFVSVSEGMDGFLYFEDRCP